MAEEFTETTYVPEVEGALRKDQERRTVQEGDALWKARKEELQRQKHREQHEVCVVNDKRCCSSSTIQIFPFGRHLFYTIPSRLARLLYIYFSNHNP